MVGGGGLMGSYTLLTNYLASGKFPPGSDCEDVDVESATKMLESILVHLEYRTGREVFDCVAAICGWEAIVVYATAQHQASLLPGVS